MSTDWTTAPLDALIDHIEARYHRALEADLPRLLALAEEVAANRGGDDAEVLRGVLRTLRLLDQDIFPHMNKEEQILFPWIRAGDGHLAMGPIEVMRYEHDAVHGLLRTLREQTDGYAPPARADQRWRELWSGLARLESDLHEHIEIENEVLFPRALGEPAA